MPTFSDYLYQNSGGGLQPVGATWVQLVNNATSVAYVSQSATSPQGLFTIGPMPAGSYTMNTGPTALGPWTPTGDVNYSVSDRLGMFNVVDYGAVGDGVTDNLAAFNAALAAAVAAGNGIVWVPPGVFGVSNTVVQPYNVEMWGAGRNASFVKALGTFPTGKPVVQGGAIGSTGVGCRTRRLGIDCNNIGTSTGWYSEGVQENSGPQDCMVRNYTAFGIQVKQGAGTLPQNFDIESCEVFSGASTPAGAVGIAVTSTGLSIPFGGIRKCTVFATGFTQLTTAVQIDGGSAGEVDEIHVENAVNGVLVGSVVGCFGVTFRSITGQSNVTNLLVFSNATSQQNLAAFGIAPQGATNSILDQITGTTKTAEQSIYIIGNGSAAQRAIITADSAGIRLKTVSITQSLQPPTPTGAVQTGQVFQGSGAPNNANGNNGDVYFRTDTPGTANQRLYIKSAGAWVGIV